MTTIKPTTKGILLIIIAALCFSTSGTTQALAPAGATPIVTSALRISIGGLALLLWCLFRGIMPRRGGWPLKSVLGAAIALLCCQLLFFAGTRTAGVAVGTVVTLGSNPIFAALLSWLWMGERPIKAWYPATVMAITGLVLLNLAGAEEVNPLRILPSLGAGLAYAIYLVLAKPMLKNHPPETVMMVLSLIGGAIILPPALMLFPCGWILSLHGALTALNLGVVTSGLAFTLLLTGVRYVPTSTATTLGLLEPLAASIWGFTLLGEPMDGYALSGLASIFLSAAVLIWFSGREPKIEPEGQVT